MGAPLTGVMEIPEEGLELLPAELTENSNAPNLVIIGISLAAFGFLLVNAALVGWFFVHQRRKKGLFFLFISFCVLYFYAGIFLHLFIIIIFLLGIIILLFICL